MSSKVKPLSWAISRYVVNWIPSSLESRCDWCTNASYYFGAILGLKNISWYVSFIKKQGAYVDTQIWHKSRFARQSGQTDQTSHINRSDLSVQSCQMINWTAPLRRSCRYDWKAYMERPIWSPDEKVMPPENLHLGLTSQIGSETGQTGSKSPIWVRSCILIHDL